MRLPLDLSNGGWHMPKSLNFRHVNRYSEDRTSLANRGRMWTLGDSRTQEHSLLKGPA